jgi:hypothetical protein
MSGFYGAQRPFHQGPVLIEVVMLPATAIRPVNLSPRHREHRMGQCSHYWKVEILGQTAPAPFIFQPIHRDLRTILVARSAAGALAKDHLTDHTAGA